jgi:hypothetical protein
MYRAYVPLQNVDTFYQAFDIKKVTECTSRQKIELKSGSRLMYNISQVKVDCPKSLDKFIINFHNNELDIVSGSFC